MSPIGLAQPGSQSLYPHQPCNAPSVIAFGLRASWHLMPLVQPFCLGNSLHPDGPRGFPPAPQIPSENGNGNIYTTGQLRKSPDNYQSIGNLFHNMIKMHWLLGMGHISCAPMTSMPLALAWWKSRSGRISIPGLQPTTGMLLERCKGSVELSDFMSK